jgi:hypothetical protein
MSESPNFETTLKIIIQESEESLEKAYQAAIVGFNQTIKALEESSEPHIKKIEEVTKQNQKKTILALKEAELKNLQKWKSIVQEFENHRENLMNADLKRLEELTESIVEKEGQKQKELLEIINQSIPINLITSQVEEGTRTKAEGRR